MVQVGKRLKVAYKKVDPARLYGLKDAISTLKDLPHAKFDETIEVVINLGVDPRQSDHMVRGLTSLPNGTGKTVRVAVFAKADKAAEAKSAGADLYGDEDLIEQVKAGKLDFDRVIATPDMMPKIGQVARILGPRGLMPNPKLGTVTQDIAKAVKDAKAGQVEYKVEKAGIIHAGVGKVSFSAQQIEENILAFIRTIQQARPSGFKGTYIKKIAISTTMGAGFKIDMTELLSQAA